MDNQLIVLDLFLKEIDGPMNIQTKIDRLRTQKAIYLGQLTGVDLGYRFSWYIHGPYSTNLTQDYYALNSLSQVEKNEVMQSELNHQTKQKLSTVKALFKVPDDVNLEVPRWLELLCSWHYLRNVTKLDREASVQTIQTQKPHVAPYIDQAESVLEANGFLKLA